MTRKAHVSAQALGQKADAVAKTLTAARTYHNQGQVKLAEDLYRQVLALDANNVDALHLLGVALLQSGAFEESIRFLKKARRRSPKDAAILVNLGSALRQSMELHQSKDMRQAKETYESAIKLSPNLAVAHFNLGRVFFDMEDMDNAIACYERARELDPDDAETYVNLGNAYNYGGKSDKALEAYEQAVRLSPNLAQAYGNMGSIFADRREWDKAFGLLDKAIAINPRPGELRFKRSMLALRCGDLERGWKDYDSRYFADIERIPRFAEPPPYWRGEDLAGKTILLWMEQGLGDEVLYSSMIPEIAALARHCILECSPRMVPVFTRSFPQIKTVRYQAQGVRTTPPSEFDVQISVTSLGKYFRSNFTKFPRHQGYLKADSERVKQLRSRYEALAKRNLIVGLSWRSKNQLMNIPKSADLTTWSDVFAVPGVTFVNLQYGDCAEELSAVKDKFGVDVFQVEKHLQ